MTQATLQPVILCGGSGTRLWPLSRTGFPKQFLCLTGAESLFQQAALRLAALDATGNKVAAPYIVSNEEHRFLAQEQLREAGIANASFLLEPTGRNTAPALTLAALAALDTGKDPILVVTPADQTIADSGAFQTAMAAAAAAAERGEIAILGIQPSHAETGYGYIQIQAASSASAAHTVQRFVEKPDASTAARYLAEGNYYWNAGMFVLKASTWLKALEAFRPDIASATQAAWAAKTQDGAFVRPDKTLFNAVPAESVDYAVMERCPGSEFPIVMAVLDAGWNDLGAWDAVWKVLEKDTDGNAFVGDVINYDTSNTLVHSSNRLTTLVGVKDLIVVDTPDALLVANKSKSQDVKHIVNALVTIKRKEAILHRKVHRPWGNYDSIDHGERYQVKLITVAPGAKLSIQMHHHRAEHWIVVSGTAKVLNGTTETLLTENQSTYIPIGAIHALENPGKIPLNLIEVQSGAYLGEDDIVRLKDSYGRT